MIIGSIKKQGGKGQTEFLPRPIEVKSLSEIKHCFGI